MFERASDFLAPAAIIADRDQASSIPSLLRANEVIPRLCDFHKVEVASAKQEQTEVDSKSKDIPTHICLDYYRKTV